VGLYSRRAGEGNFGRATLALAMPSRPWILGHRGAPRVTVENTLASFAAARAEGADGVELDVRLAACGTLVVAHDADLSRFTGRRTRVRASSAWALSRENLGAGEGIPALSAVLDRLEGTWLNVEVKADDGDPRALASAVAGLLRPRRARFRGLVVSSFEPRVLVALRAMAPELARGLLLDKDPVERGRALAALRDVSPRAIHPHWSAGFDAMRAWRAAGFDVNVWTVDRPELLMGCAEAGVTAIITNVPGRAVDLLRARRVDHSESR
jgi:glycerophosphoryl diester phosphodiesterase